jgi:prephenate dehydrogenase
MSKPIISIIGLGVTGASLGLALQQEPGNFEIVGHDKDMGASNEARRVGAVQRTTWNLHNACEGADMIILATPFSALRDLFNHIREDLRPETLVLAAVNVMQPAIALAAELLPRQTHIVVGHPILPGVGGSLAPRADLFQDATFCLAPGIDAQPVAVQLASDLVARVGAKPLFVDPQEHDGLIAGVEQLPQVVAAALMQMNAAATGWREGRRLAGRTFTQATDVGHSAEQLYGAWQSNRANLLLRVDQLLQALQSWRALLAHEDSTADKPALLEALKAVVDERLTWEGQAMLKQWDETPAPDRAEARGMFQQMFFGGLAGRRSSGKDRR